MWVLFLLQLHLQCMGSAFTRMRPVNCRFFTNIITMMMGWMMRKTWSFLSCSCCSFIHNSYEGFYNYHFLQSIYNYFVTTTKAPIDIRAYMNYFYFNKFTMWWMFYSVQIALKGINNKMHWILLQHIIPIRTMHF